MISTYHVARHPEVRGKWTVIELTKDTVHVHGKYASEAAARARLREYQSNQRRRLQSVISRLHTTQSQTSMTSPSVRYINPTAQTLVVWLLAEGWEMQNSISHGPHFVIEGTIYVVPEQIMAALMRADLIEVGA